MRRLALAIFTLSILMFSCDGRTSKKEQLQKSVSEFNFEVKPEEQIRIYPAERIAIETDYLVANAFKVKIRNYSIDDSFLTVGNKSEKATYTHHRVFESDIIVTVKDDLILKRHISAENFSLTPSSGFWNEATLEHVWVNQEHSDSELLSLRISIINPRLKASKLYEMLVDKKGNEIVNLIEENS
ncbi:MAG: hypothetical protein AAF688_14090 [Bacteroidota bacterium]